MNKLIITLALALSALALPAKPFEIWGEEDLCDNCYEAIHGGVAVECACPSCPKFKAAKKVAKKVAAKRAKKAAKKAAKKVAAK